MDDRYRHCPGCAIQWWGEHGDRCDNCTEEAVDGRYPYLVYPNAGQP